MVQEHEHEHKPKIKRKFIHMLFQELIELFYLIIIQLILFQTQFQLLMLYLMYFHILKTPTRIRKPATIIETWPGTRVPSKGTPSNKTVRKRKGYPPTIATVSMNFVSSEM